MFLSHIFSSRHLTLVSIVLAFNPSIYYPWSFQVWLRNSGICVYSVCVHVCVFARYAYIQNIHKSWWHMRHIYPPNLNEEEKIPWRRKLAYATNGYQHILSPCSTGVPSTRLFPSISGIQSFYM